MQNPSATAAVRLRLLGKAMGAVSALTAMPQPAAAQQLEEVVVTGARGLVHVITRDPGQELESYADLIYGQFDEIVEQVFGPPRRIGGQIRLRF